MERVTGLEPANTSLGSSCASQPNAFRISYLTSLFFSVPQSLLQLYWTNYWKNAGISRWTPFVPKTYKSRL